MAGCAVQPVLSQGIHLARPRGEVPAADHRGREHGASHRRGRQPGRASEVDQASWPAGLGVSSVQPRSQSQSARPVCLALFGDPSLDLVHGCRERPAAGVDQVGAPSGVLGGPRGPPVPGGLASRRRRRWRSDPIGRRRVGRVGRAGPGRRHRSGRPRSRSVTGRRGRPGSRPNSCTTAPSSRSARAKASAVLLALLDPVSLSNIWPGWQPAKAFSTRLSGPAGPRHSLDTATR